MAAWILFDVNGTLLDPRKVAEAWSGEAERMRPLVAPALQQAVHAAQVDTLAGEFRPLPDLLQSALARQAALNGLDPGPASDAVELTKQMDPYPDVPGGLDALSGAGLRLAAVTNSARDSAEQALEHAGIGDRFELVIGADEVQRYKPHPDVYRHALQRTDANAPDTWFVAAHWWDVTGAKRAGLRTAWLAREEQELLGCTPEPDIRAADLAEAAERILAA